MKRVYLITLFHVLLLAIAWWVVKYLWSIAFTPSHAWELAVSVDQLANTAFNGSMDETISSRAGRHSQLNEDRECWAVCLCWLLDKVDDSHCEKSIGI
jgi:hypothetical protein